MKWLIAVGLALAVLIGVAPADAYHRQSQSVDVMSQNLYIGADLSRLLAGESPAKVLTTVQQTDYPSRAVQIARAIDDFNPDLIGLQEVSHITVSAGGYTVLDLNFLDILLSELGKRGERYAVASSVSNADVTLPIDSAGTMGRVVDRDVILYRTTTTSVSHPSSANYDVNFRASIGDYPIQFTRGYTAVNATVSGRTYRFVNTHLEVENAPCFTPTMVVCQDVQAIQLQQALSGGTLPTILVGDFNAEPGATAYNTIDQGGYLDSWTVRVPYNNEPGFTCCQSELLNEPNQLSQRIDHIWLSDGGFPRTDVIATVVGDWDQRKTPSGLWYSDHGGPFASIRRR